MGAAALHLVFLTALSKGVFQARPPETARLTELTARLLEPPTVLPAPFPVETPRPLPGAKPQPAPIPPPTPASKVRRAVRPTPAPAATAVAPKTQAASAIPEAPTVAGLADTTTTTPASPPSASASAFASTSSPAPTSAAPGPAKQAAVELPNSLANYLNNPLPLYPKASERLREQGRTVVRVTIDASGVPNSADIVQSSGFARLDRAAQATAMAWRYVPGRRAGVPEAMSVDVPIVWRLPD